MFQPSGASTLKIRSFTLVEVLLALVIASMVFAILYTMLGRPLGLWQEAMAKWHLNSQVRLVREKMLRGIDGRYGLREAYNGTIDIQPGKTEEVEWVYFDVESDPPDLTNDNQQPRCLILINPGQDIGSRTTPGDGEIETMTSPDVVCTQMDFTHEYGKITADYTFTTEVNGKTFTQQGQFFTDLTNF